MAADFVQVPELPDMPEISYGQTVEGGRVASDGGRVMTTYCGEPVKPGVGPGVLIGEMLQACDLSDNRSVCI